MMKLRTFALIAASLSLLFVATGCKDKSPKGVCEKMMEIAESEEKDKEASDDDKDKAMKQCEEMFTEIKKEAGDEKWETFASCVHDSDSMDAIKKCKPED